MDNIIGTREAECEVHRTSDRMSMSCCAHDHRSSPKSLGSRYRRVLWAALVINGTMFIVEILAGFMADSVSLQADALDFMGDVANYGISLFVAGMALRYRSIAALIKGITMGLLGLWVIGVAIWHAFDGTLPHAVTMGEVGIAALIANAAVFVLLWSSRGGDSNMRSAWLCSRNDVVGNLAVLLAAIGVFGTGTGWPDVIVAGIMAILGLQAAGQVVRHVHKEMRPVTV
jgi:Co/Zn/Cd efflux system component